MDFAVQPRYQPVAGLEHVPGEERVARLVLEGNDPLADRRQEQCGRDEERRHEQKRSALIHGPVSVRILAQVTDPQRREPV